MEKPRNQLYDFIKKTLLNLFLIYTLLFMYGCKLKPETESYYLGSLSLDIDHLIPVSPSTGMDYYYQGLTQTSIDGENYFIGLDWYRRRLDFINTQDSTRNFRLSISKDGPNMIADEVLSVQAKDNTIFILTRGFFYIGEASSKYKEFQVKRKVDLTGTDSRFNQSVTIKFYPNMPTFSITDKYAIIPYYQSSTYDNSSFFEHPNLLLVNLSNLETQTYLMDWPIDLLFGNGTFFHPLNQKLFTLAADNQLYISYPFSSQIKRVQINGNELGDYHDWAWPLPDLDEKIKTSPLRIGERMGPQILTEYVNNAHFWPLQYNAIKDRFFRVFLFPLGEDDNSRRMGVREKWLLEYDREGRLVTKTLIPRELDMQPILLPDGAYGFPKSPTKEDFMEFAIYR